MRLRLLLIFILLIFATPSYAQDEPTMNSPFVLQNPSPVVGNNLSGGWDSKWINPGAMVYYDNQFHMFRNGFKSWPGSVTVGYTTSTDGYTWLDYENNPVLESKDIDYANILIMASSVLVETDGTWVLYFYTWDTYQAPIGGGAIGRATASAPSGPWIPDPKPIIYPGATGEWDAAQVSVPIVLRDETGYRMYYSGFSEDRKMRIGMATSEDGITWTKYTHNPVMQSEIEGEWDFRGGAERPRVVNTPDGYVMLYRSGTDLGLAISNDGITWEKYAHNPVITGEMVETGNSLWFFSLLYEHDTYLAYVEAVTGATSQIFLFTHEGSIRNAFEVPGK